MSATVETQRLISVSLGKIAQSRGQRGGINLHKNLLVATVLHKARAAYMIETFNYQQHQLNLQQQQKAQEEHNFRLQQQHHQLNYQNVVENQTADPISQSSCDTQENLGQCSLASVSEGSTPETFVSQEAPRTDESSPAHFETPIPEVTSDSSETVIESQCEFVCPNCEIFVDKENAVPDAPHICSMSVPSEIVQTESHALSEPVIPAPATEASHVEAANRLSQDASQGFYPSISSSSPNFPSCQLQNSAPMSGSTTCSGILKRRRDNENSNSPSCEFSSSANKKAKTIHESSPSTISKTSSFFAPFSSDSDYSSNDIGPESSDSDVCSCPAPMPMQTDSSQITNLVSIFNSGFSGLCAGELSSHSEQDYDSDFEATAPPQYTTLTQLCPESPSNKSSFSRNMSEPSMMCSTEVNRLDSLPSTIVCA